MNWNGNTILSEKICDLLLHKAASGKNPMLTKSMNKWQPFKHSMLWLTD